MKELKTWKAEELIAADIENRATAVTVDYYGKEITVLRSIPLADEMELVRSVVDASFDRETGEYKPENRYFAARAGILALFTNITLPEEAGMLALLLYQTDIFAAVESVLSEEPQYVDLLASIQARIDVILDTNRKEFEHTLSEAVTAIGGMVESIGNLFDGVTKEDLGTLLSAVNNGGIDEEKLVSAVVQEQNRLREEENKVVPFPSAEEDDGK